MTLNIPTEKLTESQKRAVNHMDGALLVLAGPGSGKTRVITNRIASLISKGIRPYNICAITFTNKAADEMLQRVVAMGTADGVHISTFHSLCVRILRKYAAYAEISSNFSIYDETDQKRCVKEAIKDCQIDTTSFTPARVLDVISRFKNDLEIPEAVIKRADDYVTKTIAGIYKKYQNLLKHNNALDFDDLLVKTAFLLKDFPEVRSELSNRFRYLLIDEYQDTNHAQYQIAKGLALEHGNICVTGDPDQSIYKWRGADINNILVFESDWPGAVIIKLEENFRSTPNILELADKLISVNINRKHKILIPTKKRGQDVIITSFVDCQTEAGEITDRIKLLWDNDTDLNEIAVFYRVNSMSRIIEEQLIQSQIPYQVVRGIEFYARKEIKDILSYLRIIINDNDDIAFLRAVNTHPRGIGRTTIDRLTAYADRNSISLYSAAREAGNIDSIPQSTRSKIKSFINVIEGFKKLSSGSVEKLMETVFEDTGYKLFLEQGGPKQLSAVENVYELIDSASKYDEKTDEPSLVDYLQTIALYSDTDAFDPESGRVSLMTLHAAKGLEFDNVFIVGLEEGLLPHEKSMSNNDEIEEERRLMFVGMTRARKFLHISYAVHRTFRGQYTRTVPSPFLYEMGYSTDEYIKTDNDDAFTHDYYDSQIIEEKKAPFAVNELVEHKKFGLGRVKKFIDLGNDSMVIVRFNSGKTKTFMIKLAKLERVNVNR